jgi:hypothetical protein
MEPSLSSVFTRHWRKRERLMKEKDIEKAVMYIHGCQREARPKKWTKKKILSFILRLSVLNLFPSIRKRLNVQ